MKKIIKTLALVLLVLGCFYAVPACKKNKEDCVYCSAVCVGGPTSELDYCGDDAAKQEADYKKAHPDCTITCSH